MLLLLPQDKCGYLQLMAVIFRTVVENKMDQLMMTFGGALQNGPPTQLPQTLHLLQDLLYGPQACEHKHLLLELCLTLPARCSLQIALPHVYMSMQVSWTSCSDVNMTCFRNAAMCIGCIAGLDVASPAFLVQSREQLAYSSSLRHSFAHIPM